MKKIAIMRTLPDLKEAFVRRIENMLTGFNEGRIIYDRYLEQSLNNKKYCVQGFRPRKTCSAQLERPVNFQLVRKIGPLSARERNAI